MTILPSSKNIYQLETCCICGASGCQQAIDHEKLSFNELASIMMDCKKDVPEIDSLKSQIKQKFLKLKRNLISVINEKENSLYRWLNSFYFKHLENSTLKDISFFCDILQNDFSKFPNKHIFKTIKRIQKRNPQKTEQKNHTEIIQQDVNDFLKRVNIKMIVESLSKSIKIEQMIRVKANSELSRSGKSTKSNFTAVSASNEKIVQLSQTLETHEWKHVKITRNTKTLELNNRKITDEDMIEQLPIISAFSNIKEFQIRNNKITALTCNIIANDMKFLNVLDLRGNKIGDVGVAKIAMHMHNLKGLFVSQTGITDKTGDLIVTFLPELQTLWAQHTRMTGLVCIKICQKPKLRLLSLIGNPIDVQHKTIIQDIFRPKGYLNI